MNLEVSNSFLDKQPQNYILTHLFPYVLFPCIEDIDALDALDEAVEDGDDPNDEDYVDGGECNDEEENINEGTEVLDAAEDSKKARPISLAENKNKKRTKAHPALELMTRFEQCCRKSGVGESTGEVKRASG